MNEYRLGELIDIDHGYAFKSDYYSDEGEYILLTPGNFKEDGGLKLKGDKEKYFIGDFSDEYLLEKGDLLVVMTDLRQDAPILGSSMLIPSNDRYLHNQRLGKVVNIDESKIDKEYLYHLFNFYEVREQIKASASGSTVRHSSPDRIYDVEVSIPDLDKQRKIASILSAFDDLIENNSRRIEILEEMARRIYREWFVHFRYPGNEDDELVDSGTDLGEIPEGWEVKKLEDFGEIVLGKTPSTKDSANYGDYMPFIKTPDMHDQFFIHETENVLSKKGVETQHKKTLPADSICVSCIGTAGVVAITSIPSQTNQQINSIVPKNTALREFLYFTTKALKPLMEKIGSTGATMTNVSKTKFKGLPAISVPENIINKFHAKVGPLFDQISTLQKQNNKLKETRDLLLPKLISGKVDVKEFKYKLTEDALG